MRARGLPWPGRGARGRRRLARLARHSGWRSRWARPGRAPRALSDARAELADSVALLRDATTDATRRDPRVCPWRGLAAYDVEDARWFAGRERLVAAPAGSRLAATRLLALVGASGAGSRRPCAPGLLAALGADVLPGSAAGASSSGPGAPDARARPARRWTPRDARVADLLTHLVRHPATEGRAGRRRRPVRGGLDGLPRRGERRQFLDTLTELRDGPAVIDPVVLAVRADFMGELADHDASPP